MRLPLVLFAVLAVGCASPAPPLASDQVRIELGTLHPADELRAHRLNSELVRGLRFADLPAGAHSLQVRLRYEQRGRTSLTGMTGQQPRSCILGLEYGSFEPGQTYRIVANQLGWQSVAWLEDSVGNKLASGRTLTCSPAI